MLQQNTIAKQERWVTSLVFSPDSSKLFTGGGESLQFRDGDVKIWDTKTGAELASLVGGRPALRGLLAQLLRDGRPLNSGRPMRRTDRRRRRWRSQDLNERVRI